MSNMSEIIEYNNQQREHEGLVSTLIHTLIAELLHETATHDMSKWSAEEYGAFIEARGSLNAAKTGDDPEYQKKLMGPAIQHHIKTNPHHPEYWDERDQEMPFVQAIIMYFDWKSRCIQKGTDMSEFWDYNLKKLEKHPKAKAVVELLRERDK